MILWQPMQRSTDGSPAYSERRASAWQYWHAIWNDPAWITWLKRIGWRGACGGDTSGFAISGRNGGDANERRYSITWRVSLSLRNAESGGMPGERPSGGPPCMITLNRNSSGSPFISRPSVRSAGLVTNEAADDPSPRPVSPWQVAQ